MHKRLAAPGWSLRRRQSVLAYVLLAPVLLLLVPLFGYPILYALWRSFQLGPAGGFGLKHYEKVFADPTVLTATFNSIAITVASVSIQMFLAFALALLLREQTKRWQGIRGFFILAWPLPTFVAAFAWTWLLDHNFGLVNQAMEALGMARVAFLSEPVTAFVSVVMADVWKHLPWTLIVMIAAVTLIDSQLVEALQVDGGGYLHQVRHVILPAIAPILPAILVLRIVWTFNVFDLIFLMTGGGPGDRTLILPVLIYRYAFQNNDFGGASALGMLILIVLSPLIWVVMGRLERGARS
jgi:ABC-type sugar transport systems, permease components